MSRPRLLGAVLAGGRSRRYGQPKHTVPVGGVPMVQRAVDLLRDVTAPVVIVSTRAVDGAPDVPRIPDRLADRGPLGGLHAALHAGADEGLDGVLLLACDLPLVSPEIISSLVAGACGDGHGDDALRTVAPTRDGGGVEPLCAVYGVDVLPAVERRLVGDDLSLHALFREVGGRGLDLGTHAFLNVNTPRDRDRAEASLAEREGR